MRAGIIFIFLIVMEGSVLAQFETGRYSSIGFGAGSSSHAGSYAVKEDFRTKEFSGFRALIVQAKVGWNISESSGIYGVGRYSPSNSIVSPYRSSYLAVGINQIIPFNNLFYFTGDYGFYSSSLGNGIQAGSGYILNLGLGILMEDNLHFELNRTSGSLSDINQDIDIVSNESQWFGTVLYSF